jgi:hypothetical protein
LSNNITLSKVVQKVRNYLHINFRKVWINIREVIHIFHNNTNSRKFFYSFSVIIVLWLNEIIYCGLSNIVQQVRIYLHINFRKVWINIREVIHIFRNNTNSQKFFYSFNVILALWLNEITYCGLSKVVQQIGYYLLINFRKVWINIHQVIHIFRNDTNSRKFFIHLTKFWHFDQMRSPTAA